MNLNITLYDKDKLDLIYITKFKEQLLTLIESKKIDEYFINHKYVFNVDININFMPKFQLDNYVISIDNSFNGIVPKWLTGITTDTGIYMVTPSKNITNEDLILTLHEILHYLSKQLKTVSNNKRYLFLEEALSTYICSQMTSGKFSKIVEDYNNHNLRTIKSLLELNDNKKFADNNGYYYSFFFMKFLKNNYKKDIIVEYIINSQKLLNNLEKIETEFRDFLIEQIKSYSS